MTLKRRITGAICLVLGVVFLVPAGMRLRDFIVSHLSTRRIQYLPEGHADFVVSVDGRVVDAFAIEAVVTVVGAALLLAGAGILARKTNR